MSRFGLIADTHNYLSPAVLEHFVGVERILHAGDIGRPAIIEELEQVAPVTAVLGNTDSDPGWRETEVVEVGRLRCLIRHIVDPDARTRDWLARLAKIRPSVVLFGHTHRPFCERRDRILFLNPGSASRPRGGSPASVAILHVESGGPHVQYVTL